MIGISGDSTVTLAEAVTDASMPTVVLDSSDNSKLNERVTDFLNSPLCVTDAVEPALLIVCESSWRFSRPFGEVTAFKLKLRSFTIHPVEAPHDGGKQLASIVVQSARLMVQACPSMRHEAGSQTFPFALGVVAGRHISPK